MATMSGLSADDQPEPPRLRFLRRLVYVLTGLLLAAVIVAFVGIVVKLATGEPGGSDSDASPYQSIVPLAPGETLADSFVERGLIYLRVLDAASGSARIVVVRGSNGSKIGEVVLRPPP